MRRLVPGGRGLSVKYMVAMHVFLGNFCFDMDRGVGLYQQVMYSVFEKYD